MEGGVDIRDNRKTLRANPGEDNLGRCCSKTLCGREDRFVNWAAWVAGDGADEIPG